MEPITTHEIKLHNGVIIPSLGYRVDQTHGQKNYDLILNAIKAGIRHFDIACDGDTEKVAGRAFKDCGIPRYELFITLKLGNDEHGYDQTVRAFENSMKRLGTDYADLYLINWPNPIKYRDRYEEVAVATWKGLETLYKNGKARAIGLANYEARHIEFCLEKSEIAPMVNQARIYPGFPFKDNLDCAEDHRILTEGFLPPQHDAILNSNELKIFAEKYNTVPRVICTAYLLQKGVIALVQGNSEEELRQCFDAYTLQITNEDMNFLDVMKNHGPENINPDTCDF